MWLVRNNVFYVHSMLYFVYVLAAFVFCACLVRSWPVGSKQQPSAARTQAALPLSYDLAGVGAACNKLRSFPQQHLVYSTRGRAGELDDVGVMSTLQYS